MALRKTVAFKEHAEISIFFFNQPPNLILESYTEETKEEKIHPTAKNIPLPAVCNEYTLEEFDIDPELQEISTEVIRFITMNEVNELSSHFLLYIEYPGKPVLELAEALKDFFPVEELESLTIVKP